MHKQTKPSQRQKVKDQFRILSLNIHYYDQLKNNMKPLYNLISREDPDVICLQEDLSKYHKYFKNDYHILTCETGEITPNGKLHNTIMLHKSFIKQKSPNGRHCLSLKKSVYTPRSAVAINLNVNDHEYIIINVHLTGGRFDDKIYKDLYMKEKSKYLTEYRRFQLKEILEQLHIEGKTTIILGDTNIPYNVYPIGLPYYKPEYKDYFMSGLDIMKDYGFKEIQAIDDTKTVRDQSKGKIRPDRLFIRKYHAKVIGQILHDNVSDHTPIIYNIL